MDHERKGIKGMTRRTIAYALGEDVIGPFALGLSPTEVARTEWPNLGDDNPFCLMLYRDGVTDLLATSQSVQVLYRMMCQHVRIVRREVKGRA